MSRLRLALGSLFQRAEDSVDTESDPTSESSTSRIEREIRGSIYALIALFLLVSLSSYLSLDSLQLFAGKLDRILNLGGIVGAGVAEAFLGSFGAAGYSVILLVTWLSLRAFQGKSLRHSLYPIFGVTLGTVLTAMSLFLIFQTQTPEASLLQGGWVGKNVGSRLYVYFHTTGALLLLGFGYLITLLLTTRLSLIGAAQSLFGSSDETAENETTEEEESTADTKPVRKPLSVVNSKPAPAAPKRKRAKKATVETDAENIAAEEETADTAEEASSENSDSAETAIDPNEFQELIPFAGGYSEPSPRLLKHIDSGARKLSRGEVKENAKKLCQHLLSFQITGEVTEVSQGPVLTTYEFKPSAGMKLSKIAGLQDDLGIVMGTPSLRIVAPIPGKTVVGIEVPREIAESISLKDILSEKEFFDKKVKLPVALGKSTDGKAIVGDLAAMPHLLVAGATGSGKSVFINSLITGLLFRHSPQTLRMILVDPKMLELNVFDGLPHLITNVITNNNVAFNALNWAVTEMDRRYHLMADSGSKNIESFNSKVSGTKKLPFIVIIVDELADLMMSGGQMVEIAITRLAQKARAAGIHLVIATQRPSTDVVTGLIKANIPSRIAFKVPSGVDSRTVLDTGGAESLMGRGDSLMIRPGIPLQRLHGCFVSEDELHRVMKNIIGGKNHSKNYIQFSATPPSEK